MKGLIIYEQHDARVAFLPRKFGLLLFAFYKVLLINDDIIEKGR